MGFVFGRRQVKISKNTRVFFKQKIWIHPKFCECFIDVPLSSAPAPDTSPVIRNEYTSRRRRRRRNESIYAVPRSSCVDTRVECVKVIIIIIIVITYCSRLPTNRITEVGNSLSVKTLERVVTPTTLGDARIVFGRSSRRIQTLRCAYYESRNAVLAIRIRE